MWLVLNTFAAAVNVLERVEGGRRQRRGLEGGEERGCVCGGVE